MNMSNCETLHPREPTIPFTTTTSCSSCVQCKLQVINNSNLTVSIRQSALSDLQSLLLTSTTSISMSCMIHVFNNLFHGLVSPSKSQSQTQCLTIQFIQYLIDILKCSMYNTHQSFVVHCFSLINSSIMNNNNNISNNNNCSSFQHSITLLSSILSIKLADSMDFNHAFKLSLSSGPINHTRFMTFILQSKLLYSTIWDSVSVIIIHLIQIYRASVDYCHVLRLVDRSLPKRMSVSNEISYLTLIKTLMFPSPSLKPNNDSSNSSVGISVDYLFGTNSKDNDNRKSSRFLLILKKHLLSSETQHVQISLSIIHLLLSSLSSSSMLKICQVIYLNDVFDYLIECLRNIPQSNNTLNNEYVLHIMYVLLFNLKPDQLTLKWVYIFPILIDLLTRNHPIIYTHCSTLFQILSVSFNIAPIQVFNKENIHVISAYIMRLILQLGNTNKTIQSNNTNLNSKLLDDNMINSFTILFHRYQLCIDSMDSILQICISGANTQCTLFHCIDLFSICIRHFLNSLHHNINDKHKHVANIIHFQCSSRWIHLFHHHLQSLTSAFSLFSNQFNHILSCFTLFTNLLDVTFVNFQCVSVTELETLQKWCWFNLPIRFVFSCKSYILQEENSDVNMNKNTNSILCNYIHAVVYGRNHERNASCKNGIVPLGEDEFLKSIMQLSIMDSDNDVDMDHIRNSIAFRLLYTGIKFGNLEVVCRPDLIISALCNKLNEMLTFVLQENKQISSSSGKREPITDTDIIDDDIDVDQDDNNNNEHTNNKWDQVIVEVIYFICTICKIHHIIFPVNECLHNEQVIRILFTNPSLSQHNIHFDLFCKVISMEISPLLSSSCNNNHYTLFSDIWTTFILSNNNNQCATIELRRRYMILYDLLTHNKNATFSFIQAILHSTSPMQFSDFICDMANNHVNVSENIVLAFNKVDTCKHIITLLTQVEPYLLKQQEPGRRSKNQIEEEKEEEEDDDDECVIDIKRICALFELVLVCNNPAPNNMNSTHGGIRQLLYTLSSTSFMKCLFPLKAKDWVYQLSHIKMLHLTVLRFYILFMTTNTSTSMNDSSSSSPSSTIKLNKTIRTPSLLNTNLIYHCISILTQATKEHEVKLSDTFKYKYYSVMKLALGFDGLDECILSNACCLLTICMQGNNLKDICYTQLNKNISQAQLWSTLLQRPHEDEAIKTEKTRDIADAIKVRIVNVLKLMQSIIEYMNEKSLIFPFISNVLLDAVVSSSIFIPTSSSSASSPVILNHDLRHACCSLFICLFQIDGLNLVDMIRPNIINRLIQSTMYILCHSSHITTSDMLLLWQVVSFAYLDNHLIQLHNALLHQWNFWSVRVFHDEDEQETNHRKGNGSECNDFCLRKPDMAALCHLFLFVRKRIRENGISNGGHPELVNDHELETIRQQASDYQSTSASDLYILVHGQFLLVSS